MNLEMIPLPVKMEETGGRFVIGPETVICVELAIVPSWVIVPSCFVPSWPSWPSWVWPSWVSRRK